MCKTLNLRDPIQTPSSPPSSFFFFFPKPLSPPLSPPLLRAPHAPRGETLDLVMPPRPSLQSLLLMAASAAAGGDSGLLLAARRRLPAAALAAGATVSGCSTPSPPRAGGGGTRWPAASGLNPRRGPPAPSPFAPGVVWNNSLSSSEHARYCFRHVLLGDRSLGIRFSMACLRLISWLVTTVLLGV